MSDVVIDGGVSAPVEANTVAINTEQVHVPDPVSGRPAQEPVQPQAKDAKPEPKADGKPASIDDALKNALSKAQAKANDAKEAVAAKEKAEAPKVEAKADANPEPKTERGPDGKFQPKAADTRAQQAVQPAQKPTTYAEPPSRFHEGAKAEWAAAPESVRAEVHRMSKEYEQGIQKYKADAEAFSGIREFAERAQKSGTDIKTALTSYVGMEDALRANPVAGLEKIMQNLNLRTSDGRALTLLDVAAHIMNQKPEERAMQQNSTIASLQSELAELKQQLTGVTTTIQKQQQSVVEQQVSSFAKDHPRFDELQEDIAFFLETKRASSLQEAYEMAERLNPSSEPTPLIPAQSPQTAAHTGNEARPLKPAGQKSISGSPPSATELAPVKKGATPSIDEALQRALRKAS